MLFDFVKSLFGLEFKREISCGHLLVKGGNVFNSLFHKIFILGVQKYFEES